MRKRIMNIVVGLMLSVCAAVALTCLMYLLGEGVKTYNGTRKNRFSNKKQVERTTETTEIETETEQQQTEKETETNQERQENPTVQDNGIQIVYPKEDDEEEPEKNQEAPFPITIQDEYHEYKDNIIIFD